MTGNTARVTRSSPNTLISNTLLISASLASSTAPMMPKPALLTSTLIRPKRLRRRLDDRRDLSGLAKIHRHGKQAVGSLWEGRRDFFRIADVATTLSPRWRRGPDELAAKSL